MANTLELSIHVNAKPETVFRFLSDSGWVIAGPVAFPADPPTRSAARKICCVQSVQELIDMERKSEAELLEGIPPRTWVALSADESRVVGTGASYGDAVDRASEQGETDPILLITPPSDGIQVFFL